MTKREILKETELFVLDMDGTFYLDTDVIDGALDFLDMSFLQIIHQNHRKHILTNLQKWGVILAEIRSSRPEM